MQMNIEDGSKALFDILTDVSDNYIYIGDMKTGAFRYSPHQVRVFHLPGEIIENPLEVWKKIVHPQDWERFYRSNLEVGKNGNDLHSVEFRAKTYDGDYIWLKCRGKVMRDNDGEPALFAGIMTELGQRNKSESLISLHAREAFEKKIEEEAKKSSADFAVLNLDIDNLKIFNEMYSRAMGDFIIEKVAELVKKDLFKRACVYQLEANRIGVVMENTTQEEISDIFHALQTKILREMSLSDFDYPVHISAGCIFYPADTSDFNNLIPYCELALQNAKEHGKNRIVFFSDSILNAKKRNFEIYKYLDRSMKNDYRGFALKYQPQIDAASRQIKGVEALLRWECPELGSISPMEFVPILEASGLIIPVGLWVIKQAIKDCKKWIACNPDFVVSINVSMIQIINSDFITDLKEIIEETNMPAKNILLELTESAIIENMELLRSVSEQLQKLGVLTAIDDFGTGYSSLGVLRNTDVDIVKIDKIFVRNILNDRGAQTFVKAITDLCHSIGKEVLLEGIETENEYAVVEPIGLDYIQGYLFGRPQEETLITEQLIKDAKLRHQGSLRN